MDNTFSKEELNVDRIRRISAGVMQKLMARTYTLRDYSADSICLGSGSFSTVNPLLKSPPLGMLELVAFSYRMNISMLPLVAIPAHQLRYTVQCLLLFAKYLANTKKHMIC